jgi:MFS transporter, ACS family, tartrate transporter
MDGQVIERRTVRLVGRRLLPFLFILYLLNFLDRTNVGIAALQMNDELKFSPAVFGFGAGIFFPRLRSIRGTK